MKFSTVHLLYPPNRALERAVTHALSLLDEEQQALAVPDTGVTVADNFRHTRGNHEQQRYSAWVYEPLCAALENALSDGNGGEHEPERRAAWLNDLGNLLAALGQQRRDSTLFERAIDCFQQALQIFTRESAPQHWAATQSHLATASHALGQISASIALLKRAVECHTAALEVWTRETAPQEWLLTLFQLGNALHAFGTLLHGNRQLQKAVVAYKNALTLLNADDHALELTATHNNRGATLHRLAEAERNPERMKEALHAYEKAWTVSMEQQLPLHVAVLCRVNRTTAQFELARMTQDSALMGEVSDEFELILECFPHALQPLCRRQCMALLELAQNSSPAAALLA